MGLFRARLRLQGPIASPLASGMIFGQLCWAMRESRGEAPLVDWLARPDELWGVSDAFPADCLPRPMLAPRADAKADTPQSVTDRKRLGKMPFVAREGFLRSRDALSGQSLDHTNLREAGDKPHRTARNSVDRHTGRARDEGGLFFRSETWPREDDAARDLYIEGPLADRERVGELLSHVGGSGFGKSASLGRGRFRVEWVREDTELERMERPTRYLSLSRGTRTASMADVLCRIEPHFGKAGPQLTLGEGASAFKRPMLLTRPGATFTRAGEGRFGEWLTGVHPTRPEIGHNAFHVAIPFAEAPHA